MGISNTIPPSRLIQPGVVANTAARPTSPFTGQAIYQVDTNQYLIWNGTAWAYNATPQTTEIGAWTSFTPSWVNLTPGNGVAVAAYSQVNKLLFVRVKFTWGTTTSCGDPVRMTLPASFTQDTHQDGVGWCNIGDTGIAGYAGYIGVISATQVGLLVLNTASTYAVGNNVNSTRPHTFGSTDTMTFEFTTRLA